jgi:hypothetical protein
MVKFNSKIKENGRNTIITRNRISKKFLKILLAFFAALFTWKIVLSVFIYETQVRLGMMFWVRFTNRVA